MEKSLLCLFKAYLDDNENIVAVQSQLLDLFEEYEVEKPKPVYLYWVVFEQEHLDFTNLKTDDVIKESFFSQKEASLFWQGIFDATSANDTIAFSAYSIVDLFYLIYTVFLERYFNFKTKIWRTTLTQTSLVLGRINSWFSKIQRKLKEHKYKYDRKLKVYLPLTQE